MTAHRCAPPDFVVVGAYRSGTTLLYRALGSHPDAFLPAVKEPNWFAVCDGVDVTPELRARSVQSWDHYASLFDGAEPHQLRGDASPEYLRNPAAPANIHRHRPDAALVAILRNPVERAWSDYLQHRARGTERCARFADALDEQVERRAGTDRNAPQYLDAGRYHEQLDRYLDLFDGSQLLVLLHDDLVADRWAALRRVLDHLGLEPHVELQLDDGVNASGVPRTAAVQLALSVRSRLAPVAGRRIVDFVRPAWDRMMRSGLTKPELDPSDRRRLIDEYGDGVERLGELLGRDLGHWLTANARGSGDGRAEGLSCAGEDASRAGSGAV